MTQSVKQERLEPVSSGSVQRDMNENVTLAEEPTAEVEIVNRSYQLVGMSVTAAFPEGFPAAAVEAQTQFGRRWKEIQNAVDPAALVCPFLCNDIVATYFACLEVTDLSWVPEGMIGFALPATDYAKARCTNKTIGDGHGRIFTWLEENGYEPRRLGAMGVEVYYIDDDADEEPVDILIPISKNNE